MVTVDRCIALADTVRHQNIPGVAGSRDHITGDMEGRATEIQIIEGLVKSHTLGQGRRFSFIVAIYNYLRYISAVQNNCISSKNSGEAWMSLHWSKEENHGNYV